MKKIFQERGIIMCAQKLHVSKKKGVSISSGMIGLFYEDINYSCDGGLNAEMIENPSFEFLEAFGYYDHFSTKFDGLYGWIAYPTTGDDSKLSISKDNPYHINSPHYLHFEASKSQKGVANKAYDGIALKAGQSYKVSVYLKSNNYTGKVTVSVLSPASAEQSTLATATLTNSVTNQWVKYETTLTATSALCGGVFVISIDDAASIDMDHVSMKPSDALFDVFRTDLADILKDMRPGFLRFPGGCIVEGNKLSNRYQWKQSVGPVEQRISNWNRWAVHANPDKEFSVGPYSHYNQTLAVGYYEYFLLSEYIGAKPLPVQNVGLACQYMSKNLVELGTPEFEEFIQDVLDLIEFANGPVDSTWGSVRASMGHPEPFGLEMIGIGNEQWETEDTHFFERYTAFEKAIHDKHPEIQLIGSAGPDVTSSKYTSAWDFYKKKANEQDNFTYAVDEHYYRPVEWLYDNNDFYDNYPRNVKVFAGEYAAHVHPGMNRPDSNNLESGLSEAAFLTGVERNADVVVLASYAPLLARVGYAQWSPNLIWFDDSITYGTPSYYVQKMYSCNMGNYTLYSNLNEDCSGLYQTVSYDETNSEIIIKVVNSLEKTQILKLDIDEAWQVSKEISLSVLTSEDKADYNNIEEPTKVAPVDSKISLDNMELELAALSFTVIRILAK